MSTENCSPLLLIGIGTAGCTIAGNIRRAFGEKLRYLLADTDATSGSDNENFLLLGGDRLGGHGTGGDITTGRMAATDSLHTLDDRVKDVRLAVIATSLGGGTGGGATFEIAKHLNELGIPSIVFATLPFVFEGQDRQRAARGVQKMIEGAANTTFFIPLDALTGNQAQMEGAMRMALDTLASAMTLFWRLIETPGYIRLDTERLRHLLSVAGRGRFAIATATGENRSADIVDALTRSELLATSSGPVKNILCGILGGNDLLLKEVGDIAEGVKHNFSGLSLDVATVNDQLFNDRLSCVVMLFEGESIQPDNGGQPAIRKPTRNKGTPHILTANRGRFKNSEPTIWGGEDLDTPTYLRKQITLDL